MKSAKNKLQSSKSQKSLQLARSHFLTESIVIIIKINLMGDKIIEIPVAINAVNLTSVECSKYNWLIFTEQSM